MKKKRLRWTKSEIGLEATDYEGKTGYTIERHGKGYWAIYVGGEPLRVKGLPDPTTQTFTNLVNAKKAASDHAENAAKDRHSAESLRKMREPWVPR